MPDSLEVICSVLSSVISVPLWIVFSDQG